MRKCLLLPLLLLFLSAAAQDNRITIGTTDTLFSSTLKETRRFWIYTPPSYRPGSNAQRFPVMYLLDGDAHFHSVTGLVQQLATGINGNMLFPEMIIVAILNTDRTRDLTPSPAVFENPQQAAFMKTAGGADAFLAFMKLELMPYIEKRFPTAPYRMLVGHSFGGLLAVHAMLRHPGMFQSYIAIDPSLWWNNGELLKEAAAAFTQKQFSNQSLYLAIANTLPPGMKEAEGDKDTTRNTDHFRSIRQFAALLDKHRPAGLQYAYSYFNDDDHGSVPLISEYHGLRSIFSGYRIGGEVLFSKPDSVVKHYEQLSRKFGFTILPPENLVNGAGYMQLQAGDADGAIATFAINIKNYPESANVYDSMGDAWLAKGNKDKAREFFRKALERDPGYTASKEKLQQLQK